MKLRSSLHAMRQCTGPIALAAGFFDGVHIGHVRVIRKTIAAAHALDGEAWILTFDTHPRRVVNPAGAPALLTSNEHRFMILERLGLDGCLVLPFSRRFARLSAHAFVKSLAGSCPGLRRVLVGTNWRFGRGRAGNTDLLARLGLRFGYSVDIVPPSMWNGQVVSSTRVRSSVLNGRLHEAAAMLGRPFSVLGRVTRGRGIGRKLGFPTANLETGAEVLPPQGVYAVRALVGRTWHDGIVNIGVRPTFHRLGAPLAVHLEAHLFNTSRRLYGRMMEVFFLRRIRAEQTFPDHRSLARQIRKDVRLAASLLRNCKPLKKDKESLYRDKMPVYSRPRINK